MIEKALYSCTLGPNKAVYKSTGQDEKVVGFVSLYHHQKYSKNGKYIVPIRFTRFYECFFKNHI